MFILGRESFLNISGTNHLNRVYTIHFGMNITDRIVITTSRQAQSKDGQTFFFFNPTLKLRLKLSGDKAIKIKRSTWPTQADF